METRTLVVISGIVAFLVEMSASLLEYRKAPWSRQPVVEKGTSNLG